MTNPEKAMTFMSVLKEAGFEYIEDVAETATAVTLQHAYQMLAEANPEDADLKEAYARVQGLYDQILGVLDGVQTPIEALLPLLVVQMDVFQAIAAGEAENTEEGAAE